VLHGLSGHHVARLAGGFRRGGSVAEGEADLGVRHEHHEVGGVLVHDALVARLDVGGQYAYTLVLGHDLVVLGIDLCGILGERGRCKHDRRAEQGQGTPHNFSFSLIVRGTDDL
jgi:hypothetical protein